MIKETFEWIVNNPFLVGGAFVAMAGMAYGLLKSIPARIWRFCISKVSISLELKESDESYTWLQQWLAAKMDHLRTFTVVTKPKRNTYRTSSGTYAHIETENNIDDHRPNIFLTPAHGTYWTMFMDKRVRITRDKGATNENGIQNAIQLNSPGSSRGWGHNDTISIRIFTRDQSIGRKLIEEARDLALPLDNRITVRVSSTWHSDWLMADRIEPRATDTVIMSDNQLTTILDDMTKFKASQAWYTDMGIPYRRGYLLYGPPGNGKTSMAIALAAKMKLDIYTLNLAASGMTDSILASLLLDVSDNSIILIEDIDCAFVQRDSQDNTSASAKLTFSGLLNALDGVYGKPGRILIMTSNFIDKLDSALIRDGRMDMRVYIGNAQSNQIEAIFKKFYPDVTQDLISNFVSLVPPGEVSMAKIQGHLIKHLNNPAGAIADIQCLLTKDQPKATLPVPMAPSVNDDYDESKPVSCDSIRNLKIAQSRHGTRVIANKPRIRL